MNWSDERYVKLYTRQTATWRLWPWQARCVFPLMLQVADGAGLINADCEDPIEGVAALVMAPREVVEEAIRALTKSGTVSKVDGGFLIVKFIEAQEATKTERQRKRDQRENARAQARLQGSCPDLSRVVPSCPEEAQAVPTCPELSRPVPQCPPPAQPSPAQPSPREATTLSADADRRAPHELPEVVAPPQAAPAAPPAPKKPAASPEELLGIWNERAAPALPRAIELTPKRRRSAAVRLQERPINGPGGWGEVIARISDSDFCRGEKPGHDWRASFDWLLQPDTAAKVLEGKYDNPPEKAQASPARAAPVVQLKAGGREAAAAKGWCSPGLDDWLTENAEVAK